MRKSFAAVLAGVLFVWSLATLGADTWILARISIIDELGRVFDTTQPNFSASGTTTLDGNRLTQSVTITLNDQKVNFQAAATVLDVTNNVVTVRNDNGFISQLVLITFPNPAITFTNSDGNAEVDQWILSSPAAMQGLNPVEATVDPVEGPLGASVAAAIGQLGL